MKNETKKLLLLQVGRTSEALAKDCGDYDRWFREGLGVADRLDVARIVASEPFPDPEAYAGIVVSGSGAMVTDREPWSVESARFLTDAIDAGRFVLGVCYGHQLLADALGGQVDWNPNGRQIGTVDAPLTDEGRGDPLLGGLGEALVVQTSHSQCVITPPRGAVVLARSPRDANHAIRFGPRVFGVQFHPEFDGEISRRYVEERAEKIRAEGGDPESLAARVRDSAHGTEILRRFARLVDGASERAGSAQR